MRRVLLAIVSTVTGLVALLGFKTHAQVVTLGAGTTGAATGTSTTPKAAAAPKATASAAAGTSTAARTITGSAIDTQFGTVQVQITAKGKTITAVTAVALPDRDGHSAAISQYAAPVLAQEAMAAQSARIDMISGATYTSDGYIQSLQSAIDQL